MSLSDCTRAASAVRTLRFVQAVRTTHPTQSFKRRIARRELTREEANRRYILLDGLVANLNWFFEIDKIPRAFPVTGKTFLFLGIDRPVTPTSSMDFKTKKRQLLEFQELEEVIDTNELAQVQLSLEVQEIHRTGLKNAYLLTKTYTHGSFYDFKKLGKMPTDSMLACQPAKLRGIPFTKKDSMKKCGDIEWTVRAIRAIDTLKRIQYDRMKSPTYSFHKRIFRKELTREEANRRYLLLHLVIDELQDFLDATLKPQPAINFDASLDEQYQELCLQVARAGAEFVVQELCDGEMRYRIEGLKDAKLFFESIINASKQSSPSLVQMELFG